MTTPLDVSRIAENYARWYIAAGSPKTNNWFEEARAMAHEIARFYDVKLRVVAGMVAVISPMVKWDWNTAAGMKYPNLDNVATIIWGMQQGHGFERIQARVTAFPENTLKAMKILSTGRVFPTLSGEKVTSFFINIMRPWSTSRVTIDVWMHRAGLNEYIDKRISTKLTPEYAVFREALLTVADLVEISPHGLQATIWQIARTQFKSA